MLEPFATFGDMFSEIEEVVKTVIVLRGKTKFRLEVVRDYGREGPMLKVNYFRREFVGLEFTREEGPRTELCEVWVRAYSMPDVSLEESQNTPLDAFKLAFALMGKRSH